MEKYNFVVIGLGSISKTHINAINSIKEAKLYGVYDCDVDKAKNIAEKYNCKRYITIDDVFNDGDVDIINICTPSFFHYETIIKAIEHNKHAIVEKPIAITEEQINGILKANHNHQIKIESVSQICFSDAIQDLKKNIDNGLLGDIKSVDYSMRYYRSPEYYASAGWRGTWKYDGGGALINQGIHGISIIQYLLGEYKWVNAKAMNKLHKIEVEDTIEGEFELMNNIKGHFYCSTADSPGFPKIIEIIGSKGKALIEEDVVNYEFYDTDGTNKKTLLDYNPGQNIIDFSFENHKRQFLDLIDAVKNNRKPLLDEIEGCKTVRFILKAYESNKEGKTKYLNED